ncbi:hypothetical protein MZM54_00695 [[Brevibacterium] frigoritolerans]|nr:hypothetical protein [Peribacillus frigoritolerans]
MENQNQKNCQRCGLELNDKEENLCAKCDSFVERALTLIETDPKVLAFYEKAQLSQKKATVRLDKLKHLYRTGQTEGTAMKVLKNTGRGLKKVYKFSILDLGVNFTKKIIQSVKNTKEIEETEIPKSEEELLVEEILELEEYIATEPIEFVIYEYIYTDEEKGINQEEKRIPQDDKENVFLEPLKIIVKDNFTKLNKKSQMNIAIGIIVVFSVMMIVVSFL